MDNRRRTFGLDFAALVERKEGSQEIVVVQLSHGDGMQKAGRGAGNKRNRGLLTCIWEECDWTISKGGGSATRASRPTLASRDFRHRPLHCPVRYNSGPWIHVTAAPYSKVHANRFGTQAAPGCPPHSPALPPCPIVSPKIYRLPFCQSCETDPPP